jgi:NAD-dependent oxidoreductase involved in siderophore biosynthesis
MEAYKNDYKKYEDESLWEIHKIRHQLHKGLKGKPVEKRNEDALKKFQNWQKIKEKVS